MDMMDPSDFLLRRKRQSELDPEFPPPRRTTKKPKGNKKLLLLVALLLCSTITLWHCCYVALMLCGTDAL